MEPLTLALTLASQFAPSVLRYFGAGEKPVAVAQQVIDVAKNVTGTDTGEAAIAALQQNPEQAQAFQIEVLKIDSELEQAYLTDIAGARSRDVAFIQAGRINRRADMMVIADVVGLIACLVVLAMFRKDIPSEVSALLTTIATLFGLCLRDAHQFEFGSSRGSREKDELLTKSIVR